MYPLKPWPPKDWKLEFERLGENDQNKVNQLGLGDLNLAQLIIDYF